MKLKDENTVLKLIPKVTEVLAALDEVAGLEGEYAALTEVLNTLKELVG